MVEGSPRNLVEMYMGRLDMGRLRPGSVLQDSFIIWFKLPGDTKEQNLFELKKEYNPTPHFTKNRNQSLTEGHRH